MRRRARDSISFRRIEFQTLAVASQREGEGQFQQQLVLGLQTPRWLQRQTDGQVVEKVDERRLTGPGALVIAQGLEHVSQGHRVIQGMVGDARGDSEAYGQVFQAGALVEERAGQGQRVEEDQVVDAGEALDVTPQHGHVELVAVVGDQDMAPREFYESRPHLFKARCSPQILLGVTMFLGRLE